MLAAGWAVTAQGASVDLVILDLMLPGMSGYDVCEAIRSQDRDQPIIMLTARVSDEDIVHGLKLGADDYVGKPFSVEQLVLRAAAVLRRAGLATDDVTELQLGDLAIGRGESPVHHVKKHHDRRETEKGPQDPHLHVEDPVVYPSERAPRAFIRVVFARLSHSAGRYV